MWRSWAKECVKGLEEGKRKNKRTGEENQISEEKDERIRESEEDKRVGEVRYETWQTTSAVHKWLLV